MISMHMDPLYIPMHKKSFCGVGRGSDFNYLWSNHLLLERQAAQTSQNKREVHYMIQNKLISLREVWYDV